MPTPQKEQIIQEMTDKFSRATGIYIADFTGVDVNSVVELRKSFREADVDYKVVKNTLARRSLKQAGVEGLEEFLVGVNSYAISYNDPTQPIKILEKFKKELEDKFLVKAAYFEGKVIGPDRVGTLAALPSRNELLGQFVGMLRSPMTRVVGTLNATMTKLVGVLKSLEEEKK